MTDYKKYENWLKIKPDDDLGEDLKKDSLFISVLNCAPLPCCVQFQFVKWANDVRVLAGFIKNVFFRDIWGIMFDLEATEYDSLWDMNETLLELGAVSDEELNRYTFFCDAIDKVFEYENSHDTDTLKEAIDVFNKYIDGMKDFDNKIQLFNGVDELKPFIYEYFGNGLEYSEKKLDELFENVGSPEFKAMLEAICM